MSHTHISLNVVFAYYFDFLNSFVKVVASAQHFKNMMCLLKTNGKLSTSAERCNF